ncbi:unnamed protein product, partial [Brassica rapa]
LVSHYKSVYKSFLSSLYLFCLAFLTRLLKFTHLYVFIDICDQLLFKNFFIKTYKSSSCTFNNILKSRFIKNYNSPTFVDFLRTKKNTQSSCFHLIWFP